jgi:hypothetical protein
MLQRHHDLTAQTSAPSPGVKLKTLSAEKAKKAKKVREEIKALEHKLTQILGVTCELKILTKP